MLPAVNSGLQPSGWHKAIQYNAGKTMSEQSDVREAEPFRLALADEDQIDSVETKLDGIDLRELEQGDLLAEWSSVEEQIGRADAPEPQQQFAEARTQFVDEM